jgi:predicted RNase H-like HicB family nuclease
LTNANGQDEIGKNGRWKIRACQAKRLGFMLERTQASTMNPTAQDYEVRIWYSPEPGDECYVAQVTEMPGIMAHGETREEAAREIQAALTLALEVYRDNSEVPPAPKHHGAVSLGRLGGLVKTRRKRAAARRNGAKGGRPRKIEVAIM